MTREELQKAFKVDQKIKEIEENIGSIKSCLCIDPFNPHVTATINISINNGSTEIRRSAKIYSIDLKPALELIKDSQTASLVQLKNEFEEL